MKSLLLLLILPGLLHSALPPQDISYLEALGMIRFKQTDSQQQIPDAHQTLPTHYTPPTISSAPLSPALPKKTPPPPEKKESKELHSVEYAMPSPAPSQLVTVQYSSNLTSLASYDKVSPAKEEAQVLSSTHGQDSFSVFKGVPNHSFQKQVFNKYQEQPLMKRTASAPEDLSMLAKRFRSSYHIDKMRANEIIRKNEKKPQESVVMGALNAMRFRQKSDLERLDGALSQYNEKPQEYSNPLLDAQLDKYFRNKESPPSVPPAFRFKQQPRDHYDQKTQDQINARLLQIQALQIRLHP